MRDALFRAEEFGTATPAAATIIFICPYGTPIQKVRFAIQRLLRAGYHVVAYETTTAVFTDADPLILPELISRIREDIKSRIAKLTSEGVTEFGFFGSSLGSFILYNCVGRQVPEFRWGVFNTGGNIAAGMWNMPDLRQLHVARGWSLRRLEEAWAQLQWPDFGRLDGCRFVFASSRRDSIAPLGNISQYLEPMLRAGAEVTVREVPAISHRTTVIAGLWRGPQLVRMVRLLLWGYSRLTRLLRVLRATPKGLVKLPSGADVELAEHLAQVPFHGAGPDEQLCADLLVGPSLASQPGDFLLLRSEVGAGFVRALAHPLPRGPQLPARADGEGVRAHGGERLEGRP
jgi:hypothetical protein